MKSVLVRLAVNPLAKVRRVDRVDDRDDDALDDERNVDIGKVEVIGAALYAAASFAFVVQAVT